MVDRQNYQDLVEINVLLEASQLSATKIDKSSMFWVTRDAETALHVIFTFYDYFFIDVLKLGHTQILGLLGSSLVLKPDHSYIFHQQDIGSELQYVKDLGITQKFLNLGSLKTLNVPYP